jgi:hypothetical protein
MECNTYAQTEVFIESKQDDNDLSLIHDPKI